MFLWRYPWGRPHWPLASIPLYGVRTFLVRSARRACRRSVTLRQPATRDCLGASRPLHAPVVYHSFMSSTRVGYVWQAHRRVRRCHVPQPHALAGVASSLDDSIPSNSVSSSPSTLSDSEFAIIHTAPSLKGFRLAQM